MNAIVCPSYGPPEILRQVEVPKPSPSSNEVLVKIMNTTVTVRDRRIRAFDIPKNYHIPARLMLGVFKPRKQVLGIELSGIIAETGKGVTKWQVGDKVFGADPSYFGGYQEYICVKQNYPFAKIPEGVSYQEAAAIPVGANTALHYLKKANIAKGEKVLIYAASGSVGTYAVQLSALWGAEVTAVCSEKNHALVRSLGATLCLDYRAKDFGQQLDQYDVIFVANDKTSFEVFNRHLKENGRYIDITIPFKTKAMKKSAKTILAAERIEPTPDNIALIANLVSENKIKVVIDQIFPLKEIVEAHRYVDSGHKKGNVIIQVSDDL